MIGKALLAAASPDYDFPDFDENAKATTFYTTGTTGLPKGVYFVGPEIFNSPLPAADPAAMPPRH